MSTIDKRIGGRYVMVIWFELGDFSWKGRGKGGHSLRVVLGHDSSVQYTLYSILLHLHFFVTTSIAPQNFKGEITFESWCSKFFNGINRCSGMNSMK